LIDGGNRLWKKINLIILLKLIVIIGKL